MVTAYLIRRVCQALFVTWLITVLTFILLKLLPGGPVRAILGPRAGDVALVRSLTIQLGFNRPDWYQYWTWLDHLLHGNLGFSYIQNQSVASMLTTALPKTMLLMSTSILVALLLAIPLGVAQAVHRNKLADYVGTAFSFVFYAVPEYLLGIILINAVAEPPRAWFPATSTQGSNVGSFFLNFNSMVLPIATLALGIVAAFSRYMRSATLDQVTQEYIQTARAKGAGEQRILYRHVLRNALIPIATLLGLSLPAIFGGDLIVEQVFNYPGVGNMFINGAYNQDYPVLLGLTALIAFMTVIGSLLADILYAVLDPRVRYVTG